LKNGRKFALYFFPTHNGAAEAARGNSASAERRFAGRGTVVPTSNSRDLALSPNLLPRLLRRLKKVKNRCFAGGEIRVAVQTLTRLKPRREPDIFAGL
jgi:hypothetical protein